MFKLEYENDWDDSLIRCPSQCFRPFRYLGRHFELYLRWRHNDPWQARVWVLDGKKVEWSPDLFFLYDCSYKEDELDAAKQAIEKLAEQWLDENKYSLESIVLKQDGETKDA